MSVPQHRQICPTETHQNRAEWGALFSLIVHQLSAGCLLHKFVDDTTLSEIIPNRETSSSMGSLVEGILNWSQCNLMNINWRETKQLVLGCNSAKNFCRELCVDGNVVERVNVYNLLRVTIDDTLKWKSHGNSVCAKASSRSYFLKILKRSSLSNGALVCLSSGP